ncbi:MAG: hypothetical protein ACE1YX_02765 [Nitrosopumilaceae archaeon]
MSEILYFDESDTSKEAEEVLKGLDSIKKIKIIDPSVVDLILPILFTKYGSFSGDRIRDYLSILDLQKNTKSGQ